MLLKSLEDSVVIAPAFPVVDLLKTLDFFSIWDLPLLFFGSEIDPKWYDRFEYSTKKFPPYLENAKKCFKNKKKKN